MTLSQLSSIRAARLQLIDLGDEKTAALLEWAVTDEPFDVDPEQPCVLEWGAVSLPVGDSARLTQFEIHADWVSAIAAGALSGFAWRIYPLITPQPPKEA